MIRIGLISLLLCAFLDTAEAQRFLSKDWMAAQKEKRARKTEEGRLLITPLAGPAYTPELQLTIAGGVMTSFKTKRTDSLIQRSSLPIMLGFSSTGAYFIGSKATTFWRQDKLRIYSDLNFKFMPDNYWGVGYDEARYTEKSDSTTAYERTWWQIYPKFLWQFKKNYFAGPVVDFNYTKGSNPSEGVATDPFYIEYNDKPFNGGAGFVFQYDSRDIPVNAYEGFFIEVMATFYGSWLGGQNEYEVLGIDIRKYWTLNNKPGRTIAVQGRGRFSTGEVPYGEMSQLGTPWDLRGYTWGRYRNESMYYFMGEYRHMFYKSSGEISKHGVVGWFGGGRIGTDVTSFEEYLPSLGVGYRLEVQPRMNLRIDFGFGTETFGFYFNFNEAF